MNLSRFPFAALALCGALSLVAVAPALAANPPILMAPQGVEYMCGGAARTEAEFMRMVSPRWAATFEFGINGASKTAARGQLPAPARVVVRNGYNNDLVMDVAAGAPMMLARLEPGSYNVDVTLGGLTLTQSIVVLPGAPARAVFLWPSNFDMAAVTPDASRQTALLSLRP